MNLTPDLDVFLTGKSTVSLELFHHFLKEFQKIGNVEAIPAKTMIGIATPRKRIVWVNLFGQSFLNVVFPFDRPYKDNLCFLKIAQVPGESQFNHHFRMLAKEDVNEEVRRFMKLAYELGS